MGRRNTTAMCMIMTMALMFVAALDLPAPCNASRPLNLDHQQQNELDDGKHVPRPITIRRSLGEGDSDDDYNSGGITGSWSPCYVGPPYRPCNEEERNARYNPEHYRFKEGN